MGERAHFAVTLWTFLRREPLVHFALLAGSLFAAEALWGDAGREELVVRRATIDYLVAQREELALRPATEAEKVEVVESLVEGEILVREARRRGFDDGSRIRTLLIQNMRFFLAGDIATPSEDELRAWFDAEPGRFERPPTLSLEHVYYRGAEDAPADLLARLGAGADPRGYGDPAGRVGARLPGLGREQLVGLFGPDAARRILAIDDGRWHGPLTSPSGVHYVRVAARREAHRPSFETARRWVEGQWMLERRRARLDAALGELRERYRIVIEPETAASDG